MINRNVPIEKVDIRKFIFEVSCEEAAKIQGLLKKYGCMLFVKVEKPISPKTVSQNNTIHALIEPFYYSGYHSAPESIDNYPAFRDWVKYTYGVSREFTDNGKVYISLKSLADYSKSELSAFIDKFKIDIRASGALSGTCQYCKKLCDIFAGIED